MKYQKVGVFEKILLQFFGSVCVVGVGADLGKMTMRFCQYSKPTARHPASVTAYAVTPSPRGKACSRCQLQQATAAPNQRCCG